MLLAELKVGGETVSQNEYFFRPFKELALVKPNITMEVAADHDGFGITVSTDKVAKDVYLAGPADGHFSDNYFTLLPGHPVEIRFDSKNKLGLAEFEGMLRLRSLKDAF